MKTLIVLITLLIIRIYIKVQIRKDITRTFPTHQFFKRKQINKKLLKANLEKITETEITSSNNTDNPNNPSSPSSPSTRSSVKGRLSIQASHLGNEIVTDEAILQYIPLLETKGKGYQGYQGYLG